MDKKKTFTLLKKAKVVLILIQAKKLVMMVASNQKINFLKIY
jgi:hypothetical protein